MTFVRNPEHTFGEPGKLAAAHGLTLREKLEILTNWRADLIEPQHADEENMSSASDDADATGTKLSEVTFLIDRLKTQLESADPEAPADLVREPAQPHSEMKEE
jgi:hypothetical protein